MEIRKSVLAAFSCILLLPRVAFGACPVDRAPVKAVTDPAGAELSLLPLPATIESLQAIPPVRPLPQDRRIAPAETTIHSVTATLIAYRLTAEAEIQLVLSDEARRTIVAYIPSPACVAGSRFSFEIERARAEFERRYIPTEAFTEVRRAVQVQGVGFFDFLDGERGLAPNGLSIYPVTLIDFTPPFQPKAPPLPPSRRRAVGSGGAKNCTRPALNITTSRPSACANEQVTVTWQAADSTATVTIDGIGELLPSSGSRTVTVSSGTIFSGHATTSCGKGNEAFAVVTLAPAATASLSGPSSVNSGSTATLSVTIGNASSWTLTSSLGNSIEPNNGTSSRSVTYRGSRTGTDTVRLVTAGGACGNAIQTKTIVVGSTAPPAAGLLCCDGTRSPSCFNCNDKRGCCSGHGGVCGCP